MYCNSCHKKRRRRGNSVLKPIWKSCQRSDSIKRARAIHDITAGLLPEEPFLVTLAACFSTSRSQVTARSFFEAQLLSDIANALQADLARFQDLTIMTFDDEYINNQAACQDSAKQMLERNHLPDSSVATTTIADQSSHIQFPHFALSAATYHYIVSLHFTILPAKEAQRAIAPSAGMLVDQLLAMIHSVKEDEENHDSGGSSSYSPLQTGGVLPELSGISVKTIPAEATVKAGVVAAIVVVTALFAFVVLPLILYFGTQYRLKQRKLSPQEVKDAKEKLLFMPRSMAVWSILDVITDALFAHSIKDSDELSSNAYYVISVLSIP
jgi:hypothetical protein